MIDQARFSGDCRVTAKDLTRLAQVKELLTLLNDAYVGPLKLAECIDQIPVFAARCCREASRLRMRSHGDKIEWALQVLGNRGVEKVLLELLEDMTILKSDLEADEPSHR